MAFIVRQVKHSDLASLFELTKQFTLLNLPSNLAVLEKMIYESEQSFAEKLAKEKSRYIFIVEDTEVNKVVASSMILAKHGSSDEPHYSFQVITKEHFSKDIGIGFKHNVLRFKENKDGPSEIGGLLVDKNYRNRPERLGKLISLARFIYMSAYRDRFQEDVLCELSPPLTSEGRSEFWEALGRRFTGLPYAEADQISHTSKEFITSLFPKEDIYISLLDAKARLDVGRIAEQTKPAKHMLESVGFKYLQEVDPFDGGPHYGAKLSEIKVVNEAFEAKLAFGEENGFDHKCIVAGLTAKGFHAGYSAYAKKANTEIMLPSLTKSQLGFSEGQNIFIYPLS